VRFQGVEVSECPFCGGGAFIPDGVSEFAGEVADLIKTNVIQRAQLQRLKSVLERALKDATGDGAPDLLGLDARLAAEVPEAKPLFPSIQRFLKANADNINALAVLIAIVSAVFAYPSWKAAVTPPTTVEVPVPAKMGRSSEPKLSPPEDDPPLDPSSILRALDRNLSLPMKPARRSATANVGPNDPCWCGSGKKKKKCHRD
jgi:hypothetical protein